MSLEAFNQLFQEQEGRCAVCRKEFESSMDTHVDHCHKTGAVRGILCKGCNHGLGNFADSTERLLAAVSYLKSFL
jgi:hypothetical protein